jgi:peptidoglycan/xylan/chitin deacetylase (PgdA/CDA1 family)
MLKVSRLLVGIVLLAALIIWLHSRHSVVPHDHEIEVALTVDDLPGMGPLPAARSRAEIAQDIIQTLKATGVPAYGFANGVQLDANPTLIGVLQQWGNAGFPIGNHTFSHANLVKIEARAYTADIERMDQRLAVLDLAGSSPSVRRVFRYPYLAEGETLEKRNAVRDYLFANSYRIAEVTVDYDDWVWNSAYTRYLAQNDVAALEQLRKQASDSALRRLHESIRLSRMLFSRDIRHIMLIHMCVWEADELRGILERYRAAGVRFITLDRALKDPVYSSNPNCAYSGSQTFLQQWHRCRSSAQ